MANVIKQAIEDLDARARRIVQALAALRALDADEAVAEVEPPADAPAPRKYAAKKRAPKKHAKPPKPAAVRTADDRNPPGSLQSAVIAAIKARPLSSREIFEKLTAQGVRTTQDSVYQTCHAIKARGEAETRVDETDGQRRWHLLHAKGAAA